MTLCGCMCACVVRGLRVGVSIVSLRGAGLWGDALLDLFLMLPQVADAPHRTGLRRAAPRRSAPRHAGSEPSRAACACVCVSAGVLVGAGADDWVGGRECCRRRT